MVQPDFFGDGTSSRLTDGSLTVLKKILGVWQNKAGALTANNPRIQDGRHVTMAKILAAKKGVAYGLT